MWVGRWTWIWMLPIKQLSCSCYCIACPLIFRKMAMDDSPILGTSPRISFSHDLCSQSDGVPVEHYITRPSSPAAIDFDFCVFRDYEVSSADDLFFDGKILPIQIKKRLPPLELGMVDIDKPLPQRRSLESGDKHKSSFWRSSSWNCGGGQSRTFCPLPLLSRSFSTGSSTRRPGKSKQMQNGSLQKQPQVGPKKKTKTPCPAHGVRFNLPPANLFGLSSIFFGWSKSNKKH